MRILIFLAALAVVGLVVTGAIKLQKTDQNTITIQIDKQQVKDDAARVVKRGKAVFEEAENVIRQSARESDTK
jgi:hypothetical protein